MKNDRSRGPSFAAIFLQHILIDQMSRDRVTAKCINNQKIIVPSGASFNESLASPKMTFTGPGALAKYQKYFEARP